MKFRIIPRSCGESMDPKTDLQTPQTVHMYGVDLNSPVIYMVNILYMKHQGLKNCQKDLI